MSWLLSINMELLIKSGAEWAVARTGAGSPRAGPVQEAEMVDDNVEGGMDAGETQAAAPPAERGEMLAGTGMLVGPKLSTKLGPRDIELAKNWGPPGELGTETGWPDLRW